jgi:hypothetical protein
LAVEKRFLRPKNSYKSGVMFLKMVAVPTYPVAGGVVFWLTCPHVLTGKDSNQGRFHQQIAELGLEAKVETLETRIVRATVTRNVAASSAACCEALPR